VVDGCKELCELPVGPGKVDVGVVVAVGVGMGVGAFGSSASLARFWIIGQSEFGW